MLRNFRIDGKTILALLTAALLLLIALFGSPDQDKDYNTLFEKKLWLPGRDSALALMSNFPEPAAQTEEYMAMEGSGEFQNSIKIPESLAAKAAPAANGATAPADETKTDAHKAELIAKYNYAIRLMKEGKLADAERELTEYVVVNPDDSEGWRQLGDCRYNLGKVPEALGAYRLSLRKDDTNYLAERGRGVASLYLGYDSWEKDKKKIAHDYFQNALTSLHTCLQTHPEDELARYGQALSAEGASRQLYLIAVQALNGESSEKAKEIIRNCLDILDAAIGATEDRLEKKTDDTEARMLLGCLLIRRAKILQPFGHLEEATANLRQAVRAFEPLTKSGNRRSDSAKGQVEICQGLIKEWNH